MMRITLARHGKPEFELSGKVRARDLPEIAKSYDASGIVGTAPRETVEAARGHNMVVCSDLTRSLESAKALGLTEIHAVETLFREAAIPHFTNGSITLPIGVWVVVLRSLWLLGFSRNGESLVGTKQRARQAAQRLMQLAAEHGSVLLVGHGFINHFIARELMSSGWAGPSTPGKGYWEFGVYQRTAS